MKSEIINGAGGVLRGYKAIREALGAKDVFAREDKVGVWGWSGGVLAGFANGRVVRVVV